MRVEMWSWQGMAKTITMQKEMGNPNHPQINSSPCI